MRYSSLNRGWGSALEEINVPFSLFKLEPVGHKTTSNNFTPTAEPSSSAPLLQVRSTSPVCNRCLTWGGGLGHLEAPKSPGRLYHRTRSFTLPFSNLTSLAAPGVSQVLRALSRGVR